MKSLTAFAAAITLAAGLAVTSGQDLAVAAQPTLCYGTGSMLPSRLGSPAREAPTDSCADLAARVAETSSAVTRAPHLEARFVAASSVTARTQSGLVDAGDSKVACVGGLTSFLPQMERNFKRAFNCLEIYNTPGNWQDWVDPYFIHKGFPYAPWVAADPGNRTIVASLPLIPADAPSNWRLLEAAGLYDGYAEQLARGLVAAGLGHLVIRLGEEMNGDWYLDNIGTTSTEIQEWVLAWRQVVSAMRSVPGAHFLFDWNVNAGYRTIPLSEYYPGNAFVDIVGVDAYDVTSVGPRPSTTDGASRWAAVSGETGGLDTVLAFAQSHGKPLSLPEWGLLTTSAGGAGDDPTYVREIGHLVAADDVAYQGYFMSADEPSVLHIDSDQVPASRGAYLSAFG